LTKIDVLDFSKLNQIAKSGIQKRIRMPYTLKSPHWRRGELLKLNIFENSCIPRGIMHSCKDHLIRGELTLINSQFWI